VLLTLPIKAVLDATPRARIVRLDLGGRAFRYAPGQAVLVATPGSGPPRPLSIAIAPDESAREGFIELLVGTADDGPDDPHLTLEPGTVVDVEGPIGGFTFPSRPEERRFAFVAGGTGIAPLRAMLHHALDVPHDAIGVLYSARTAAEFAYEEELRALARDGRIELRLTVTRDGTPGWTGSRGRITGRELAPLVREPETLCFVCGPPALVDDIPKLLQQLGVARRRIRIEEW